MGHDLDEMYDAMLDLAAGRLDAVDAEDLQRRIDADPALGEDYAGIVVLSRELHAYGDSLVSELPTIDITDAVLARVKVSAPDEHRIVPFVKPAGRRGRSWWVAAAAAAAIAAAVWGMLEVQKNPAVPQVASVPNDARPDSGLEPVVPPILIQTETPQSLASELPDPEPEQAEPAAPDAEAPVLAENSMSPAEIVKQRQNAAHDDEAREVLARWAALSPEKARAVMGNGEASQEAIVGAALALGGEEAVPILQQAAAGNPEDPFLNIELARATGTAPKPDLDEENGLGWYVYARQLLSSDPPNLSEALKALEAAEGYAKVNSYALEAASYHEQALIASGVPPESAHLLTAFTTGPSEYDEMTSLGMDLLEYGQYFLALGESEASQAIIEAVQRFGQQLDNGALFSHERYAALEIQDAALQVLETIYQGTQLDALARNMDAVAAGFNSLVAFMGNINELLSRSLPEDIWQIVADIILRQGDLQIFNNLPVIPQE